jgi:radical SAM superfamily enzyme YgiQ (UPF0313 family)
MQTIHNRSLDWMNRGHHHMTHFVDALERSRGRGFEICAHVMLGLPGETREDMLATAQRSGAARTGRGEDSQLVRGRRRPPWRTRFGRGEVRS